MNRWIEMALKVAIDGHHPAHKMGAVLIKGGSVIQRQANYTRSKGVRKDGFHAEERAIIKAGIDNCKGATIIVARLNKNNKPGTMSRPCPRCLRLIERAGIKKIIYVNWTSEVVMERL